MQNSTLDVLVCKFQWNIQTDKYRVFMCIIKENLVRNDWDSVWWLDISYTGRSLDYPLNAFSGWSIYLFLLDSFLIRNTSLVLGLNEIFNCTALNFCSTKKLYNLGISLSSRGLVMSFNWPQECSKLVLKGKKKKKISTPDRWGITGWKVK